MVHNKEHKYHRISWLRAAVLGANDGIISTASLLIGVAMANNDRGTILIAGIAGLSAGAMSMAAGEYVSVSSQSDIEKAEILLEERHLSEHGEYETNELAEIYVERGLEPKLAREVAEQLMAHDALGAHMKDELGLTHYEAKPIQAAIVSSITFTIGALLPLIAFCLAPSSQSVGTIAASSLASLALLGAIAAGAGGASIINGSARVVFWGSLAMGITATIGKFLA